MDTCPIIKGVYYSHRVRLLTWVNSTPPPPKKKFLNIGEKGAKHQLCNLEALTTHWTQTVDAIANPHIAFWERGQQFLPKNVS